jgi:hypothetical protein
MFRAGTKKQTKKETHQEQTEEFKPDSQRRQAVEPWFSATWLRGHNVQEPFPAVEN